MRKKTEKIVVTILTLSLITTSILACTFVANAKDGATDSETSAEETVVDSSNAQTVSRKETVYGFADATGNVESVTVSEWLNNTDGLSQILDATNLSDIVNLKGDETYAYDEEGNIVWEADGNDITYQGTSNEELPVSVSITYKLDGTEVDPSEIVGKSGKLEVIVTYDSSLENVPFLALSGIYLDESVFTNISVTNAKLIETDSAVAVLGFGITGLSEALSDSGIPEEYMDKIPTGFSFTADVENFSMQMTLTTFMKLSLETLDTTSLEEGQTTLDELVNGVTTLNTSSESLTESSSVLADGCTKLASAITTAKLGAASLEDGAKTAASGSTALVSGVETLVDGIEALLSGATSLSEGSDELYAGAEALATSAATLASGAKSVSDGVTSVATGVDTLYATIEAKLTELTTQITQLIQAIAAYEGVSGYEDAVETYKVSLYKAQGAYGALAALESSIETLVSGLDTLETGATTLSNGASALSTGAATLSGGAESVSAGALALLNGISDLKDGADTLLTGVTKLDTGLQALYAGATSLTKGLSELETAGNTLATGLVTYNEYMTEFNEGVNTLYTKITEAVSGITVDFSAISEDYEEILNACNEYETYTEVAEGEENTTVFIIKTAEVK